MKWTTWDKINLACIVAGLICLLFFLFATTVHAMDHGFDKSLPLTKYLESLMRPDLHTSCCGKGDAYPVERYKKNDDHTWTVWISEEGQKPLSYPDGKYRYPVSADPIIVPDSKVNDLIDDQDNPSDSSWIFMSVSPQRGVGNVFCFIRHPMGG